MTTFTNMEKLRITTQTNTKNKFVVVQNLHIMHSPPLRKKKMNYECGNASAGGEMQNVWDT